MAEVMSLADFQQLVLLVDKCINKIRDTGSLLKVILQIFKADLVFLSTRSTTSEDDHYTLTAVMPIEERPWVEKNWDAIRKELYQGTPNPNFNGYTRDKELEIDGKKFADLLVGFGGIRPRTGPPDHLLFILGSPSPYARYTSYHCWAAAYLLRNFEHIETIKQMEYQKVRISIYSKFLNSKTLPQMGWDDFYLKLEELNKCGQTLFTELATLIIKWFIIHARETDDDKNKFQTARAQSVEWLKENQKGDSIFLELLELVIAESLDIKKIRQLVEKTPNDAIAGGQSLRTLIMERIWLEILSRCHKRLGITEITNSIVETGVLYSSTSLISESLDSASFKPDSKVSVFKPDNFSGITIDRDALQLYLGLLITTSKKILNRYLGFEKVKPHTRLVPAEVSREFVLNLARFMVGLLGRLRSRFDEVPGPPGVSPIEFLDSLLFLVDRYAHVELGVEEVLQIRKHLAQGFLTEAHRHMTQPFYRDHLLHVVDVFLLGHILLHTSCTWLGGEERSMVDHLSWLLSENNKTPAGLLLPEILVRNWAVAALLHDIGYQIGEDEKSFADEQPIQEFFRLRGSIVPKWLSICGSPASVSLMADNFHGEKAMESWLPPRGSYDIKDHGVLSALRVTQILTQVNANDHLGMTAPDLSLTTRYYHAIHAMAHHNLFNHTVYLETHPLACLLRLCDELQEWNRPRVINVERILKHLYLNIEGEEPSLWEGYRTLRGIVTNLTFIGPKALHPPDGSYGHYEVNQFLPRWKLAEKPKGKDHPCNNVNHTEFVFGLSYQDSSKARFDPILTVLNKAYNLQFVDLSTPREGYRNISWKLILYFPCPEEYRGVTEYDIYGLFTDRVRLLPLFWQLGDISNVTAGLVYLKPEHKPDADRFGIVVANAGDKEHRHGWLPLDPNLIRDEYKKFKEEFLKTLSGR